LFEYLAKRFAEMLTKGDVIELFRMLEQRYGTKSEVCDKIGIERKTFYHWRDARQINAETKAKVLKAALEEHPIDVLGFLARKTRGRTKEILELLIEFLRREMLEEEDFKRTKELVKKAEEVLSEFSTPLTEYLRHEITDLIEDVYNRGFEIEIKPYVVTKAITALMSIPIEKLGSPPCTVTSATTPYPITRALAFESEEPQENHIFEMPEGEGKWSIQ